MLPNAVKKQLQVAEDKHKQVYGQSQDVAAPANTGTPAPEAREEKEATTQDTEPAPTKNWEGAYKVLQGKYNAEVPRLSEQNRALLEENRSLTARIEALEAKMNAQPAPGPIKPEEVQEYGEAFTDFVKRAASTVIPNDVSRVPEIEKTVQELRAETDRNARRAFISDLTTLAPNWKALNEDPDFIAWLDEADKFSGKTRQQLLDDAHASLDASRAAVFFNAFPGSKGSESVPDLSEHVVPEASAVERPTQGKRIWTPAEVNAFYRSVARGEYAGRDQERLQIERDLMVAAREGRFRRPRVAA